LKLVANLLVAFVALCHLGFLVLEMFFWNHPVGRRIFAMTPEVAASSEKLAKNQGLYNGFLAAGLLWGLAAGRRRCLPCSHRYSCCARSAASGADFY
jgi:putative membrane protein